MRIVNGLSVVFCGLTALYLVVGGAWLLAIGGSPYYVATGIALLAVAWLMWRRHPAAFLLYAVVLVGTAGWGLWESGPDFWALVPRCDVLVIFGLWLLLVDSRALVPPRGAAVGALLGALVIWGGVLVYAAFNDPQTINGTFTAQAAAPAPASGADAANWPAYGRTEQGTRYSPLAQITPDNVKNLQVAWTFRTGDMKGPNDPVEITNEVTPLAIDGMLYLCSPHQILFALDARTGELKWKFDLTPEADPSFQHVTCRGVSYADLSGRGEAAGAAPDRNTAFPGSDRAGCLGRPGGIRSRAAASASETPRDGRRARVVGHRSGGRL